MKYLKTLAFLLGLLALSYTIVHLITLFVRAVAAIYTGGDATSLLLFLVAAAAFFAVVYAVVRVANWILPPDYSSNLPEYREREP